MFQKSTIRDLIIHNRKRADFSDDDAEHQPGKRRGKNLLTPNDWPQIWLTSAI
jgi:hypothetical protein